jgi:hypothetical protein
MTTSSRACFGIVASLLLLGACKDDKVLKVTGLDPKKGDFHGGTTVTFSGNRFLADGARRITVYFGKDQAWKKADVLTIRDDEFTVRTPAYTDGDTKTPKKVDILIEFEPGGERRFNEAFEYYALKLPSIDDVDTKK